MKMYLAVLMTLCGLVMPVFACAEHEAAAKKAVAVSGTVEVHADGHPAEVKPAAAKKAEGPAK